jgi:hypothetical protein
MAEAEKRGAYNMAITLVTFTDTSCGGVRMTFTSPTASATSSRTTTGA